MKGESTYQAARLVATKVAEYFLLQLNAAEQSGELNLPLPPSIHSIEKIIDISFWSSLLREEGRSPKISLALLPAETAINPMLFEKKITLTSRALTKLSPGVERAGVHIGVWPDEDGVLHIWGTTIHVPNLCLVTDVSEPGLIVIKHRRTHGFWKFANVAVLMGDQVKLVDGTNVKQADCPNMLKALLGFNENKHWSDDTNILIQLAVSMRAHMHGGILLVVNKNNSTWKESIIHPMKYKIIPAYLGLSDLVKQEPESRTPELWKEAIRREIDSVAGLTAVDGATIINDNFELLSFGAKIARAEGKSHIKQISYIEPVLGNKSIRINPAQTGGTRHLSAAQFVHEQHDALALVASQDGHFTIFSWSDTYEIVQAHRIDTLLL
jgi:hypothetical protein